MNGSRARNCRHLARVVAKSAELPDVVYDVKNVTKKYSINTGTGPKVATVTIPVKTLGRCTRRLTKMFKKAYILQKSQGLLHAQN